MLGVTEEDGVDVELADGDVVGVKEGVTLLVGVLDGLSDFEGETDGVIEAVGVPEEV